VRYQEVDPRYVYGSLDSEGMDHEKISQMVTEGKYFKEVPLGEGSVDFDNYFKALQDIGYTGYLTIEREVGTNPEADIRKAVEFILSYR
jgi:L-ribulose-5-phosphate 3-epimerase